MKAQPTPFVGTPEMLRRSDLNYQTLVLENLMGGDHEWMGRLLDLREAHLLVAPLVLCMNPQTLEEFTHVYTQCMEEAVKVTRDEWQRILGETKRSFEDTEGTLLQSRPTCPSSPRLPA
jgi:hypothetical protein